MVVPFSAQVATLTISRHVYRESLGRFSHVIHYRMRGIIARREGEPGDEAR